MSSLDGAKFLSLIDAGISNLWSLSLPSHLVSLNLHGNNVQNISNLSHLTQLVHLDLSANHISTIDGLERLASLKTLNLSSNLITKTDGFNGLRSLQRLNLSYNHIDDIGGLAVFSSPSHHLQYLALHGNRLRDIRHVVQILSRVTSLTSLVLSQDGSSNPLCHTPGYPQELWTQLPQLQTLDDLNRQGRVTAGNEDMFSIPGLESFLDFLLTNGQDGDSEHDKAPNQPVLITPKIDAVMEQFKHKYTAGHLSSTSESSHQSPPTAQQSNVQKEHLNSRQKSANKKNSSVENSSDESEPVQDGSNQSQKRMNKKNMSRNVRLNRKLEPDSARVQRSSEPGRAVTPRGEAQPVSSPATTRKPRHVLQANAGGTVSATDDRARHEAENLYKDLMRTLEEERERRWKAEQATRRLADLMKDLQARGQQTESMKNSAMEATVQLKQAVMNEHESKQALSLELTNLKTQLQQLQEELDQARRGNQRSHEALKSAEASLTAKESEALTDRIHQAKKLQESQQRASAMSREVDLLRHSLEVTNSKVQQLQETLASREHQHREEVKHLYSLESPDLQKLINDKLKGAEKSFQSDLVRKQQKIEQLSKQYSELENEFRCALQLEEARFSQLQADLTRESSENLENKQLLLAAQRKDESCTAMIAELTALVKEQKERITELAKCKQEQAISSKERVESLQESVESYRKQTAQMEILRQEKSKLQATVQAQESVIQGLKSERKLWGQELAQQGASLSQDRGRLESKIEALNTEITSLKKQLEREADTVKIKTKMVDDQTETIRKLKEAVVERDETIKVTREESLSIQRSLEDQLTEVKTSLDDIRELLDRTTTRKDELKHQLGDLQRQLQESRDTHSNLSVKWKEKSELIGQLEKQVTQMKNNWTQKETQLAADRDAALAQARQAIEQMKAADRAFRQQLELKEAAFQEKITQLDCEKQQEIELANQKVAIVEEEMRDLLKETEANKLLMENKLKKLTQALGDIQTSLK